MFKPRTLILTIALSFILLSSAGAVQKTVPILMNDLKIAVQTRQWDDAIKAGTELVQMDPKNVDGHWYLAKAYSEKMKFNEAGAEFRKAMEYSDKDKNKYNKIHAEYLSYFGLKMKEAGEFMYSTTPDNPPADFKPNYGAAKIILEQMQGYNPDSARVYYWLFLCEVNTTAKEEQMTDLIKKAVELEKKIVAQLEADKTTDPKVLATEKSNLNNYNIMMLELLITQEKYYDEAEKVAREIIEIHKDKADEEYNATITILAKLLSNKALALDPEKDKEKYTAYIKEALGYLDKATAANPKDTDLKNLYAYTLYLDGNYEKAVTAMEEMYKADPKGTSSGIVSAIYDCYSHLKNKAKMDEYEKVLEERYK